MKEVRNREVQNKGCHARTIFTVVFIFVCFTVISLINVDISSHISINRVIKALYGFTEAEEHLNKRGVEVDSGHSGSGLVLGKSHPVGLVRFHCSL